MKFEKGDRVRNHYWKYNGTVQYSLGNGMWLIHADAKGGLSTPVEANETHLMPEDGIIAGENSETRAVLRYLGTELRLRHTIADGLRLDSAEQFEHDARRALGDATEVTWHQLEGADWQTVFNEVKEERDA